jgi:hypothetical protein
MAQMAFFFKDWPSRPPTMPQTRFGLYGDDARIRREEDATGHRSYFQAIRHGNFGAQFGFPGAHDMYLKLGYKDVGLFEPDLNNYGKKYRGFGIYQTCAMLRQRGKSLA